LVDKGKDGLFALIDWTKWGIEAIKSKLFKYISPEFDFEYTDPENGQKFKNVLYGVALTNRPFMKGMQPVVLSENLVNNIAEEIKQKKGGIEMDLKKLIGLLKLKEDATEAEMETKIGELMGIKPVELKDVRAELELTETATVEDIVKKIKEVRKVDSGKVTLTEAEVAQLKADAKDGKEAMAKLKLSEATALVDKALADGKITAAQKEWAGNYALSNPEGFKKFIEAAPKVVSTTETGSGGEGGEHTAADKVNQEAQKLMKENKGMSFTDAVRKVLKDSPDLAKEYEKESSAKKL
jgi:phage I-like protein